MTLDRASTPTAQILLQFVLAYTQYAAVSRAAWYGAGADGTEASDVALQVHETYRNAAEWCTAAFTTYVAWGVDPIESLMDRNIRGEREYVYLSRLLTTIKAALARGEKLANPPEVESFDGVPPYESVGAGQFLSYRKFRAASEPAPFVTV